MCISGHFEQIKIDWLIDWTSNASSNRRFGPLGPRHCRGCRWLVMPLGSVETRCRDKPDVSPPGCTTSRLHPATPLHQSVRSERVPMQLAQWRFPGLEISRAVRKSQIHGRPWLPWFSPCTVIFGHCRDFVSRPWILAYYIQFRFWKGRYCLSFAVLFHFGRVPVMHTVI